MPAANADRLFCLLRRGWHELRLHGLPERDPESVDVTNDELTHAVEGIIKVFHDLNPVLKASVQVINVIGGYVQVDLATVVSARSPASVKHDFAVSERQLRPVSFAILFISSHHFESYRGVPIDRGADIRNMNHRNDGL